MKEVFKMSPLFTGNQNLNIRRMSDDSAISLLASSGDFSSISNSSTISIFEETAIRENKYLSKITKLLGKNITFIVALSGNITAQMIISTTVAKTPWNWQTIKDSLIFSGILIGFDTAIEPFIFGSIENIENWVIDKWKNNENNINVGKEIIKVIPFLLFLSYSGVILDRASNNILDNWISMEILGQTTIEFTSYVLNMTFHGAIISRIEKVIKLGWEKVKRLFNNNINDIENQLLNSEQNSDENSNFFYKNILPLFFITPISMAITWGTENYISNQEFTWKKLSTDAPKIMGGITLSLVSSLLNCMVNKEGIPFLPKLSTVIDTIKRWTGYQQNNGNIEQSVTSCQSSINDSCLVDVFSELESIEEFSSIIGQLCNEEEWNFKNDEEKEIFFDAVEEQKKVDSNFGSTTKPRNNYGTFNNYCEPTNFLDNGISSSILKTEFDEQSLLSKPRSFTI